LVELFDAIPDLRQASGKRYARPALLALAGAARLCGSRSYSALAEWGRNSGQPLVAALGFAHGKPPDARTGPGILRHLDCAQFASPLGQWADPVLASQPPTAAPAAGGASAGKPLRGSQKPGAPGTHWLSARSQRLGVTRAQPAVAAHSNALDQLEEVLEAVVRTGRSVTPAALPTQRDVAQTLLDGAGDAVMLVKGHPPAMLAEMQGVCQARHGGVEAAHGRSAVRHLPASSARADDLAGPGFQQVCARTHAR